MSFSKVLRYLPRFQLVIPCSQNFIPASRYFSISTKEKFNGFQTNFVKLELPSLNKSLQLNPLWLRDHCRCPECYNSITCQRNIDLIKLEDGASVTNYTQVGDSLQISWSDGHQSIYSADWILKNTYEGKYVLNAADHHPITTWDAKTIQSLNLEPLVHSEVMNNNTALVDVYKRVLQYGFVQIAQVPEAATASLFERICRMSRTVFGTFWETGTNFNHKDTGYLNGYLEAHTDNTYFSEAQGLIAFHCTHFDGEGCESFFVDGFHVAEQLKREDPDAYAYLSDTYMESEYIEPGEHFSSYGTCFRHHPITHKLEQVRFNMLDRAPLTGLPQTEVGAYYKYLQLLTSLVRQKENIYWLNLRPGNVMIIDNWRLLHGRTSYVGKRVLRGCYFTRSDFFSRAKANGIGR